MTRDEHRNACIEAIAGAMIYDMFADHELPVPDDLWHRYIQTATAAFDALDPIAVVRTRNGLERWADELTNPPRPRT